MPDPTHVRRRPPRTGERLRAYLRRWVGVAVTSPNVELSNAAREKACLKSTFGEEAPALDVAN